MPRRQLLNVAPCLACSAPLRRASVRLALPILSLVLSLGLSAPTQAAVIFSPFATQTDIASAMGTSATIGFAYAGNKFVGSIQRDGTNVLFQTDLSGGSVAPFAPTVSLAGTSSSEHYVSSSLGLGGFPSRDIYVASGNGVMHITNNGASSNVFVTGLNGLVRGILFDPVGTFGFDMLVTTTAGGIYRVNSAGVATLLASTGEDTEGLDVAQSGPDAGKLLVASEGSGSIRTVDTAGHLTVVATIAGAEELSVVPLGINTADPVEGMYGANYPVNIVKAPASDFVGLAGDIIVTGEFNHQVWDLHWNGTSYLSTLLGSFPNQPEDGIFVSTAIVNPCPAGTCPPPNNLPEPGVLLLFCATLFGLGVTARRRTG